MVTLYFGENAHSFPNAWEELTAEQYLKLIPMLNRLWSGEISLYEMRVDWFKYLAGIEDMVVSKQAVERVADNIYTASAQFNFWFTIEYDGGLTGIPKELQEKLRKHFPDDVVGNEPELRHIRNLKFAMRPDTLFARNLLPTIFVDNAELKGWQVEVSDGVLTTSLTALQFLQGNDILRAVAETGSRKLMAMLASVLYARVDGGTVDITTCEKMSDDHLNGIVLCFQAFVSFLFTRTHYSILWAGEGDGTKSTIELSQTDSLYSLAKSGYGSYEQIERMPLTTYLSIIRADMINSIRTMATSFKKKLDEIASETHLPISLISKIIGQ